MSIASTTTVARMVYENLGITDGTYGNYKTNQRYPKSYILDAIAGADITVMKTLLKSKQYHFTDSFFATLNLNTTKTTLPANIELLKVGFFYNDAGDEEQGVEIPWGMYEMFTEPLATSPLETNLFSMTGEGGKNYGGYFTVKDHNLFIIPFSDRTITPKAYCKYIALPHPTTVTNEASLTLFSPQSFEQAIAFLASSNLLMKRADQPEQASFYLQQYQTMMGLYMTPSTNQQRTIDQ